VSGNGTKMVVQGNTAGYYGGGVYADTASFVAVSSGASLEVVNNSVSQTGGGVYLKDQGFEESHHHQIEWQYY
jgi:predicted outer membrane repeat protein